MSSGWMFHHMQVKQHSHISKAFQTQACPHDLDPSLHELCLVCIRRGITAALLEMCNNDALTHICGARGGEGGYEVNI